MENGEKNMTKEGDEEFEWEVEEEKKRKERGGRRI